MCTGGCSGGGGTSGRGRTPYTPKNNGSQFSKGSGKITAKGGARTVGRASDFGNPKVRASFSSRTRK